MTTKITLPSGAEAVINDVSLELAFGLQDSINESLLPYNLSLHKVIKSYYAMLAAKQKDEKIYISDIYSLEGMSTVFLAVTSSKNVRDKMFECLLRCTVNNEKITLKTFEDAKRRGDYLMVFMEVLKKNIFPFFSSLV